jgi:type IV secretion system protein VirD4
VLIIVTTLATPTYVGLTGGFIMGHRFMLTLQRQPAPTLFQYVKTATNPVGIAKGYQSIHKLVSAYKKDPRYKQAYFNTKFDMKFYGPLGLGGFLGLFILFLMRAPLMDFRPFREKEKIHGDAKWSDESDLKRAKLRAKKGLLMGRTGKADYLIADDFQHVLLFAPTGSGKGVGFVIPNLLFWEQSVIVHDIKGENYELTSGYRHQKLGQPCYYWNPADPNGISHCYNPLDWISDKPGQMVDDVQKICNLVLPEQEFWQNEARSLMLGIILYLCAVPEKVTSFGEVVRTMRSDDVVYNLAVVLDTIGGKIHPVAYMNLASFLQKADKERSGVVSTLNSALELWANPLIDTTTASSDFDLQSMKKKAQSVYVGVTPDNLQRLEPLLKVFYQQATDFMTRNMPKKDEPFGVMYMLDEFPSLGEMPQFQVGIAYFRGFRVKLFLIVQDTQQLKGIYEEAGMNSFLSNSYYRVTYSANNIETANMISQMVGNKTAVQESHNKPKYLDFSPHSRTMQVSETQRALLLPQEVIQLPRDEQIILVESFSPIKCKKIFYYKDPFFKKRLLPPPELPVQEPYDPNKKKKVAAAPPPPADGSGGAPATT